MTAHLAVTNNALRERFTETTQTHQGGHGRLADPALLDDALATYMKWRETTDAIAESYGRWSVAPAAERAPRFAAYVAALDQEQTAAAMYAESIIQVPSRVPLAGLGDPRNGTWLVTGVSGPRMHRTIDSVCSESSDCCWLPLPSSRHRRCG